MNIIQKHTQKVTEIWKLKSILDMFYSVTTVTNEERAIIEELILQTQIKINSFN